MAKQFLRISKTNASKNKVQLLVILHLELLDKTLFNNYEAAEKLVTKLFRIALKEYNGSAKIPELKRYCANKETIVYFVEDLIYIDIIEIKLDLSN